MTSDIGQKPPLWRDDRFWRIAIQVIFVLVVIAVVAWLGTNLSRNIQQQAIKLGFDFLQDQAKFGIGDTPIPYKATDPYSYALLIGLANSLRVMVFGIILTTIVGITAGIASFSDNWLVSKLSLLYVEIVRNTPLLLQLLFWYFGVFFQLPKLSEKMQLPGSIFLSKRGIYIPWPPFTTQLFLWLVVLLLGAIAAFLIWQWRTKVMVEQAQSGKPQLIALIAIAIAAVLIIIIGFGWQRPQEVIDTGNIEGGLRLTIEFCALLAGLVFYTGAFIAEIVRAGIESVQKGQWEAARSLGLKSGLAMRLVIFPQALRVIIPSLNSQYMNLAKNSSLASAIGYPDIYSIAQTTFNQAGHEIEIIVVIIPLTYLTINLIISFVMNLLNRTVQLQER